MRSRGASYDVETSPSSGGRRYLPGAIQRLVATCSVSIAVGALLQISVVPLLPDLAVQHDLDGTGVALVAGSYSAGVLLAAVPTGWMVSTRGSRFTMAAANALLVAAALVLVVSNGPEALFVSRLLQGLSGSMMWGAAFPWVAEEAPPQRVGRSIGVLIAASVVGGMAGPMLPAVLAQVGYRPVFLALALMSAAAFAGCMCTPVRTNRAPTSQRMGRARWRDAWTGCWLLVLAGLATGSAQVLGALRLGTMNASAFEIGAIVVVVAILQAALSPVVGRWSDSAGSRSPILLGLSLLGPSCVAMVVPSTIPWQALAIVATSCLASLITGPTLVFLSHSARRSDVQQGTAFVAVNLAWSAGTFLGNAGSGLVSQSAVLFWIAAFTASTMLASVGLLVFRPVSSLGREGFEHGNEV